MNEEVVLLQSDLKNTETELRGIVRIQKRLYWFLAPGVLLALWVALALDPLFCHFRPFWRVVRDRVLHLLRPPKGLGRRRDHLVERLTDLGHPPEFN